MERQIETPVLTALLTGAIALFAVLANHRLSIVRENSALRMKFIATLHDAIATLSEPRNIAKDAFSLLEESFPAHHSTYLLALSACSPIQKYRLRKAWCTYYGDGADNQDWWLPNEYGTVVSNKLDNSEDNTRLLAIQRLETLIAICS